MLFVRSIPRWWNLQLERHIHLETKCPDLTPITLSEGADSSLSININGVSWGQLHITQWSLLLTDLIIFKFYCYSLHFLFSSWFHLLLCLKICCYFLLFPLFSFIVTQNIPSGDIILSVLLSFIVFLFCICSVVGGSNNGKTCLYWDP